MTRPFAIATAALLPVALTAAAIVAACTPAGGRASGGGGAVAMAAPETDDELLAYGVGFYLGEEVLQGMRDDGVAVELDHRRFRYGG